MKNMISIVPTITLLRIDPRAITKAYDEDVYADVTIPRIKCSISSFDSVGVRPTLSSSPDDPSFCIRDKSGYEIILLTSNIDNYNASAGLSRSTSKAIPCFWCGEDRNPDKIGRPVACSPQYDSQGDMKLVFYCVDSYCDEECALADIRRCGGGSNKTNCNTMNSEYLISIMYLLKYPDSDCLEPALDFRLLKRYGGTLTYPEFKNKTYRFSSLPNIITSNCKPVYQQRTS